MLKIKERTMDKYVAAGASMRLLKEMGNKALIDASAVLSAKEQDMFINCLNRIDLICSRAEDNMLEDHPDLGGEFSDVFYGGLDDTPRTDLDREVMARAKETADGLFERKAD